MSIRVDTTSWLAGAILIGSTGFGVLGSEIASAGSAGPGYAYNDLTLPADATKEICGRITTWPSNGTLQAFEDTSFIYSRTGDGVDSFAYQLYVDGMPIGSPQTVTLTVGIANAVINLVCAVTSQNSTSSTAVVTVTPPAPGVINLVGSNNSQSATSSTGSVSVTQPAPATVNLAGSSTTQSNMSGTGVVTVNRVINLTGSSCSQVNASSTVSITIGAGGFAIVPAARTVSFSGGGTNRVNFSGGGTNRVNF